MNTIYFRYKKHPGDFYRNTDFVKLPNPKDEFESFLIQFLKNYQSDEKVTFVDDMYKLIDDYFFCQKSKSQFMKSPLTRSLRKQLKNHRTPMKTK